MMGGLRRFLLRILASVRPGIADRQLDRELTSHVTMLADELERQGMTPPEAARAARRQVGHLESIKEQQRDARSFAWLEDTRRDLQYAIRTLARAPGFTLAVVFTLALGIGAVTAIYTVIYNVLLNPLPYRDSHRLVNVFVQDAQTGRSRSLFSPPEFLDFKDHATAARLLAVGPAIGIAASFGTNRLIRSQLLNTSPQDPIALAGAIAVITLISIMACCIPARRAMRVDPMRSLRQD